MNHLQKKQLNALNALNQFIINHPLATSLNDTLNDMNYKAIGNFINGLSKEDFIMIQNDEKLKIENTILSKILTCHLIDDKPAYLNKKVIYGNHGQLWQSMSYPLSSFLKNEAKNIYMCSKNKWFLKKLFLDSRNLNEDFMKNLQNGLDIKYEEYAFNKNALSEDFLKFYIDYRKNYDVYMNHPRMGAEKLSQIVDERIHKELVNEKSTLIIEFKNFSIEFEQSKK